MHAIQDYWAFVAAFLVFLAIPGPGNLVIITSTSQGRLAGGAAASLGVMAGDQVLIWLAVAGVAALVVAHPQVFALVQYAGAAYLAYLGVKMLLAKPGDAPLLHIQPHHHFRQAFWITLLNPKAVVFYMAFFPMFVNPARHPGLDSFIILAATAAVLTVLYCTGLILITHFAAERVRASPRLVGGLNKLAGSLLVAFGAKLALSK